MKKISEPTLLLDQKRCIANIRKMSAKADRNKVMFRPHFKTHQSVAVGNWFRDLGVCAITVSSLRMAEYFANNGWRDITVAFPVNVLEMERINRLAGKINLNLLIVSVETVNVLQKHLQSPVNAWVKIDTGYQRTGMRVSDKEGIGQLVEAILQVPMIRFSGFLTHAGHSYKARTMAEVHAIHYESIEFLQRLKKEYMTSCSEILLSVGDTPTCSLAEDFSGVDEIRPGNFVFYDVAQLQIGSCLEEEIAVAMACPIVAMHPERNEMIIYGGSVHFSKDACDYVDGGNFYGYVVDLGDKGWSAIDTRRYVKTLSQEHGVLRMLTEDFSRYRTGDVIGILPIHSCLTANAMASYSTLEGEQLDHCWGQSAQ